MFFAFASSFSTLPSQSRRLELSRKLSFRKCMRPVSMTANWPDDPGPAYSKYLSFIPMDRLNKAPVITINNYSNEEFDGVGVRLADMLADEGAGDQIKAGISELQRGPAPPESAYSKYFDPATLHEAPFIGLDASNLSNCKLSVVWAEVPLQVNVPNEILEQKPEMEKYALVGRLNFAPNIQIFDGDSDEDSNIYVNSTYQPLDLVGAELILDKYRK